ncbi:MAG: DUF308 domain-containing protein [Paracoccus sp. (in: a-proteobacteria)]|nr:DUF308 domain-containing protein [Paracoccus sp. (in: a-proteobacteria)]
MGTSGFMLAAGLAALIGGLLALINPTGTALATVTLVAWALLAVAALQAWAAWRAVTQGARIRAGIIAGAAALIALFLFFGDLAASRLLRSLIVLMLLISGGAKIYAAQSMQGDENMPLVLGTGAISLVMGLVLMFGLNPNFGTILGVELLASGLGLVLIARYRKKHEPVA